MMRPHTPLAGPAEEVCCDLDCLVQPRFYCGQLLTDADLQKLLGWAQDKFRLVRYRHGWGVACGLDVRCDPQQPGRVRVGPGYAVSCCGDDVVVCEETTLDLRAACTPEQEPCDLPPPREDRGEGEQRAPGPYRDAKFRRVDLFLRYKEEPREPQAVLGCGTSCGQHARPAECEYSRTLEGYELVWRPDADTDPLAAAYDRWLDRFEEWSRRFKEFVERVEPWDASARRAVRDWLRLHPTQFGFLHAWAEEEPPSQEPNRKWQNLWWLGLAWRNEFLTCPCHPCEGTTGVPLARVWLARVRRLQGLACVVVSIDTRPPYRRLLQPEECWPAPVGQVNLGRLIWHQRDRALAELAGLGFSGVTEGEIGIPTSKDDLVNLLKQNLVAAPGPGLHLQWFRADPSLGQRAEPFLGPRVIGYRGAQGTQGGGEETEPTPEQPPPSNTPGPETAPPTS